VIHAADGEEALACCERKVAEVLVTDVRLPGAIEGWQIGEQCREQDPRPVIYATGYSPVKSRPVPGSRLFQKPYQPDQILQAIREVAASRQSAH
jgi:CheY-like chemotaxis protein